MTSMAAKVRCLVASAVSRGSASKISVRHIHAQRRGLLKTRRAKDGFEQKESVTTTRALVKELEQKSLLGCSVSELEEKALGLVSQQNTGGYNTGSCLFAFLLASLVSHSPLCLSLPPSVC